MSTPAFTVGQIVTTHDKNFEPDLALGSEGTITHSLLERDGGFAYDVDVTLTDGSPENFYFFEHELKPVE